MSNITRNRASVEYLNVPVTSDVTLDAQPVELAVVQGQPAEDDWQTAAWQGSAGTTRTARLEPFIPPGTGTYSVFVRITDSPEVPVFRAGRITFT